MNLVDSRVAMLGLSMYHAGNRIYVRSMKMALRR
jgi:hypothetical protein